MKTIKTVVENSQHSLISNLSEPILSITSNDEGAYILTSEGSLYKYKDNQATQIDFDQNLGSTSITSMEKYADNLYVLDENQRTIYKH